MQIIDGQHDQDTPQAPCPSAGPILGDNLKESPELAGAEPEKPTGVINSEDGREPIDTKPQYLLDSSAKNVSLNDSSLSHRYRELAPAATANSEK
ncbi:MAG: hypothetical protein ACKO5E_16610, partial [bacterium]